MLIRSIVDIKDKLPIPVLTFIDTNRHIEINLRCY